MSSSHPAMRVDLSQLNPNQLGQLSQQLDKEIETLSTSAQQLKIVLGKFHESKESLGAVKPANESKDILVPLTTSLYVTGKLSDANNVIVDIGTGYYLEKPVNEAVKYFDRRIALVNKQLERLHPVLQDKVNNRDMVQQVLQMHISAAQQQMAKQGKASAPTT